MAIRPATRSLGSSNGRLNMTTPSRHSRMAAGVIHAINCAEAAFKHVLVLRHDVLEQYREI